MSRSAHTNQPAPQPGPDADPVSELAREAFRYLNLPAGEAVQSLLVMCGYPSDQKAVLGEVLEMILNPDCGLLERDSSVRRVTGDWFSALRALYRAHADSDEFLSSRRTRMVAFFSLPADIDQTPFPLTESKYAMLSMSSEILQRLTATLGAEQASSLARAMADMLRGQGEALLNLQDCATLLRLRAQEL